MARKLPTWLTAGERRRLLKAEMSPRDRAIITVFLFAGLRSNELRMLDVDDVDFEAMSLLVRFAKRSKQRLIPLHAEVAVALEAHLAGRSSGPVFLSSRRQRLSNRRLRSLVKALGQRAGLRKPLHPHALRHSFAVGLADAGRELDEIQELLGHENIETTVIYTHCSVERKRAAIDSL